MRVFDETKTNELTEYDLEKGYLKDDRIFIAHHEAVEAVEGEGHYETVNTYPNGGKDVEWVIDVAAVAAKEAYDEYEDIKIYIPYTEKELEKITEDKYAFLVESYIRERYSLSAELAILRQRESKPEEFAEYNAYAEECKARAKTEQL
jgi:hypothetical protein